MNLEAVILSDPLILGLENRAFREGLVNEDAFLLREHARPAMVRPSLAEMQATDMLCLYDRVWTETKRFDLGALNAAADHALVNVRPPLVRALAHHFRFPAASHAEWSDLVLDQLEADGIKEEAAHEAQYLLRRDIAWYLADARSCFETEAPRWREVALYDRDLDHAAVAGFLQRNIFWLVELFGDWFWSGDYNHALDAEDLEAAGLPRHLVRQFRFFAASSRFDAYFRHIQDAYTSLLENGFVGRLYGMELAYERAPDRRLHDGAALDAAAASRIIRVNLSDIADYFPLPRTLEEAIEIRQHPRVTAFRSALDGWLSSISDEPRLEARLRRDVERANRELTNLKSWRALKDNPIYFGVKTAASLVPVVGTFVGAIDAIDYFVERRVKRRSAWVVPTRGRLD